MQDLLNAESAQTKLEPGSFRDRNNRVFYIDGQIYRGLSEDAYKSWQVLSETKFFSRFLENGKIVKTQVVEDKAPFGPELSKAWEAFLKHQAIPFISYPYEWSCGMLKDAALLQLDLLDAALEENMTIKDATAYNIQWQGAKPVFIDIPSFEVLQPGEPWVGYRQFCQMYLYPLMLQAYKNMPFHTLLRGDIDGITPTFCSNAMSFRDMLRSGVLLHVYLHAKAEARYADSTLKKEDLQKAGVSKAMIQANVRQLKGIVQSLEWKQAKSVWSDYATNNSYSSEEHQTKANFVREVVTSRHWKLVWDLGCNTGTFSRIASENADYVISMDADHLAIERFYQQLKAEGNSQILPLVNNMANPSPSQGWRGQERKSLPQRGTPQLTLCLALIHHIVISANIPLAEFVDWLATLGTAIVIEFVTKDDPMVKVLLRNKTDNYVDYELPYFEAQLASKFQIQRTEVLQAGTRKLFYATPLAQ